MIISFTNVIGAIRSLGESARVITTNLKMWLGFETSETLGREEVVNGDFADGTTGWQGSDAAANISISNNRLRLTNGDASAAGVVNSSATKISFKNGLNYQISYESYQGTSTNKNSQLFLGTTQSGGSSADKLVGEIFTTDGIHKQNFTSTSNQELFLTIKNGITTSGIYMEFDNISVKELTQITPDKSGNNNVGELFTGKALDFNGSTDYVDTTGFEMAGTSATFAFWIYPKDTAYQFVMDLDGTVRTILGLFNGGSGQFFSFFNFGFKQFGTPTQNQWQRVVFRVNATTVECYVDGVKSGSTLALTSSIDLSTVGNSVIGGRFDTSNTGNRFDGSLSDFQIYNAYWSTDDIAYDYANPNKLAIDNPSTSLSVTNLKAYWALSEGDGLVAYDSGTNLEEEEVENGDFDLGSEEVTNGDFATDLNSWDISNNDSTHTVTYSNGSARYQSDSVSPQLNFDQTISNVVVGKTYQLSIDVTYTTGNLKVASIGAKNLTDGLNVFNVVASTKTIRILRNATVVDALINSVSLKEVPNWTLQSAWSISNNKALYDDSAIEYISQSGLTISAGKTYQVSFDIGDTSGSGSRIQISNQAASEVYSPYTYRPNGSYVVTFTPAISQTTLTFKGHTLGTSFSLSNVSLKEITASDHGGLVVGATYVDAQPRIPQLGMMNWAKSTPVSDEVTLIPNPTIPTQDILGNAVRDRLNSFNLDGSGYAEVADDTDLDFGTGDFSVEAWVRFEFKNQGSSLNTIYSNGEEVNDTNTFSLVSDQNNKIGFYVNGTSCFSTSTFSLDEWVHVVGTRIQGTNGVKLYINGNTTPEDTATNNNTVTNSFDKTIGYDTHSSRYYNNIISDVRLYDRALSSDEIENNYNAGLSAHTND